MMKMWVVGKSMNHAIGMQNAIHVLLVSVTELAKRRNV